MKANMKAKIMLRIIFNPTETTARIIMEKLFEDSAILDIERIRK